MASSRAGLRSGSIVLVRGTAASASITGIENARVLPVPVCAVATMSRPSMSGGMACARTGIGVTNSFLSRLFCNAEQRLSSEKCCINCVRFFLRRNETRRSQGMQDQMRIAETPKIRRSRQPSLSKKGRLSRGTAGRRWRKRAAFSKRLHVIQRTRKLRGPLLNVLLPSGIVGQHRVVEHQCVNEL